MEREKMVGPLLIIQGESISKFQKINNIVNFTIFQDIPSKNGTKSNEKDIQIQLLMICQKQKLPYPKVVIEREKISEKIIENELNKLKQ